MSKPAGVTECTAAGAAKVRANALLRSLRPRNQRLVSQRSRMGYKKAGRYAVCVILVNVEQRGAVCFEFELFADASAREGPAGRGASHCRPKTGRHTHK